MILLSMILPKNSSVKKGGRIIYSRIILKSSKSLDALLPKSSIILSKK